MPGMTMTAHFGLTFWYRLGKMSAETVVTLVKIA